MGEKRPSVRTLETGEKVTHYPDGRQVLLPRNSLADTLNDQAEEQKAASIEQREALVEAAAEKREALAHGTPVPSDKRSV